VRTLQKEPLAGVTRFVQALERARGGVNLERTAGNQKTRAFVFSYRRRERRSLSDVQRRLLARAPVPDVGMDTTSKMNQREPQEPYIRALRREIEELTKQLSDMERNHQRAIGELKASLFVSQVQTVDAIVEAIEAKDPYTSGHSRRVMELSLMIGAAMHLEQERMWRVHVGALLHDVGKIGVLDQSLRKTTRLDDLEYLQLKAHPLIGERIVRKIDQFADVAPIVRWHHERYDGQGYPDGLKGDQIPVESAIIFVADAYDAITSKRTYNKPRTRVEAADEIQKHAGTQFHPDVAAALRAALEPNRLESIRIDESDFQDGFDIPEDIGI